MWVSLKKLQWGLRRILLSIFHVPAHGDSPEAWNASNLGVSGKSPNREVPPDSHGERVTGSRDYIKPSVSQA